ncbi:MAG TPA: hypothetical protein VKB79_16125 [Bryobacteraceae bacterium]|nr:hypothetical protein [Bryobacteraceae bacterium]
MNPLEGIGQYLDRLERRLRVMTWTRGAAAITCAALILTLAIVGVLIWSAFTPSSLIAGRFVLFLGIGAAIALALIVPLMRMNRRRAAQEGESKHPGFEQRLLTFTEKSRDNASDPFLPLLAADALRVAREAEPERVIENGRILRFASLAAACASVLVWLMFWGPGVLGNGTALLWGSYPKDSSKPLYSVDVQPGSKTIRRKTDQMVSATLNGFTAPKASLFVRYASASKWEEGPMQRENAGSGFALPLVGVPEDLDYYVEAGGIKSSTYHIRVVDLPNVKNIRVTYDYPSWTGMKPETEDPGGDLRAVEGTVAKLEIQTDRALSGAQIVFDDGKPLDLSATENNKTNATVTIEKDGAYHLAMMDHGEVVRLTDDYFIEARKVSPPQVRITKPGRDAKVSPIEEVDVQVAAEDEYPLQELQLHYSVNGAAEKTVPLLKEKGGKKLDATTMLSMEDFKLVPGDIVSIYATAKDGKNSAKTDMFFIQAVPFEFNYTQSQQQGGGGGGMQMDQEQQISEREKEIIAATFNQVKGDAKAKAAAAENGKYLADVQAKLRDQATSMANRTKARQLDANGAAFQQFVKEMEAAVAAMTPASEKLKALAFSDALAPEQQALQHLLRAESTFRDIQIQISRGGGGGGGGGGGAGRDLANLFDLELDKDKNQYENNSSASSQAEQQQKQIDDAMKKLADLARRQQELAQQQQNNPQQLAQQRWQQEMLRREAEQLRRDMQQMQQGQQNGQQGQQSSQQGQQGGQQGQQSGQQSAQSGQSGQQSGQSGQSGQQQRGQQNSQGQQSQQSMARNNPMSRGQQQQLEAAIRQLEQATRDMSNAASARQQGEQGNAAAQSEAQRAAERLQDSQRTLQSMRSAQTGSEMSDIANKAEKLADQQQDFEQRLRQNFSQGEDNQQTAQRMADEKKQMHSAYDQLQKQMQTASRDLASSQTDVSKKLRDAIGKSQQDEIGNRMDFTEQALRQGMGQYAVMREAPVTRSLNELKDDLKQLEAMAGAHGAAGDDRGKVAMQQALDQAERVRREIEQLTRAAQAARDAKNGQNGQQNGRQGGQPGGQQAGNRQQGGQQQGGQQGQNGQQGGQQQASSGQPGGQNGQQQGEQQGQGQQQGGGQQGGGQQQAGNSPQGSYGNRGGGNGAPYGGIGPNGGPIAGAGWRGDNRRIDQPYTGDLDRGPVIQSPVQAEGAYSELMRDLARLRGSVADDKDLAREYQDLVRNAQQLDPKRWATNGQLDTIISGQLSTALDEVELLLRRKMDANDGSVRSANPTNAPPGYSEALREYYKRLSRQ